MNKFEIAKLWQTTNPTAFLKILLHTPCKLITREVAKYIQFILNEIKKYIGISVISGVKGLIPSKKDRVEPDYYDYTKTELFENQIKGLFQGLGIDKRYFAEAYQKQYNIVKEFLTEEYQNEQEQFEMVTESVCLTDEGSFQYTIPSDIDNVQPEKVELYVFSDKEKKALEEYAYKNGHSKEKIEEAVIKEVGTYTLYDASNEIVKDFYQNLLLDRYTEQSNDEKDSDEFTQEAVVDVDEYQEVTIEDVKEMMRTLGLPYETVESFYMDENGEYSYVDFTSQNGGKVLAERVTTDTRLLKIKLQGITNQVVPEVDEYLFEDGTKIIELETKINDFESYMQEYLQEISYSEDPQMKSNMRKNYADMEVELASMRSDLALLEKDAAARAHGTTAPTSDKTRDSVLNERIQKEYNESSLSYEAFKALCEECGIVCEINPKKEPPEYVFQPAFVKVVPLNKTEMLSLIDYASSKGMNSDTLKNNVESITVKGEKVFLQSESIALLNESCYDLVQEWRKSLEKEIEEEKERLDVDLEISNNKWIQIKKEENPDIKKKIQEKIQENPERANSIKVSFMVENSQRGKETETHVAIRMPKGYFEKSQSGKKTFVKTSEENWGKYILMPKENIKESNKHSVACTLAMDQQFPLCDDGGNIIYADPEMKEKIMVSGISVANHFVISKMTEEDAPAKKRAITIDGIKMEYVKSKNGFGFAYSEKEKKAVLLKYTGKETDIKIPAEIKVNDVICVVTEIKDGVFEELPIESLSIPDTVTEIRNNVCKNCTELKTVKMSKNLKDIGSQVLRGCVKLESITANPGGNTYTHNNSLIIKQIDGEKLYTHAMNDKSDSIDIPATVTQIGDYAFEDSFMEAVILPDGVAEIGNYAFSGCSNLSNVHIPSTVKNIGASAFRNTFKLNIVNLDNVETIGTRAFADSGIKSVTLNNIREVGSLAFERCFLLEDAHINTVHLTKENFAPSAFTRSDNFKIEFYKEEIKKPVQLGEYDEEEILSYVTKYLNNKFAEIECPDLELVDICLYGSRSYGKETEMSDLDVLVEYKGSINEDALFNILHEDDLTLAGISVDINPITEEKSGTLAEYLERSKKYLKENVRQQELIDKINASFNMEETTVEGAYNALVNMNVSEQNTVNGDYASVEQYIKEIKESGFLDNASNTFAAYYDELEETEAEVELHAVERALYFAKIDELDAGIDESQEVFLERGNKKIKGKELYDYLLSYFKDDANMSDAQVELKNLLESYAVSYQPEIDYKEIVLYLIDKEEEEKYENTKRFNYYEKELLIEYAEMARPQDVTELVALIQQLAQEGHGATISLAANPSLVSLVEKERLKYANNERVNRLPSQPSRTAMEESTQSPIEEKEPIPETAVEQEKSFKEQLREEVEAQLELVGGYRKNYSKEERQSEAIKTDYDAAKKRLIDLTYNYINQGIGYHYQGDKRRLEVIEAVAMSYAKGINKTISNVDAKVEDLDKIIEEMSAEILNGIQEILKADKWNSFSAEHAALLQSKETDRKTIVINAYGGAGAGKTTACLQITEELKKAGYVAEYVQEYAKDLVWEENWEMLDGTQEHQFMILEEQLKRMDRLYGKVDFIVTDAPILLNSVYNNELTIPYEQMLSDLYGQYKSFNFFVQRDASKFEKEGRMQNLEESIEKDEQIKAVLDKNGLYYGTYNHDTISKVVNNAITAYLNNNKTERVSEPTETTEQDVEEPEIQEPIGGVDENTLEPTEDKVDELITNAAEAEKPTSHGKETKIEDFGEKIGGARKDLWKSRGLTLKDIAEFNDAERKKYITKDNIWKKPDYTHLIEEGLPVNVAYFYKTVRDALKTTPNISTYEKNPIRIVEKQEQYIEFVTSVRDAVAEVRSTEEILAFKDKFLRDGGYIDFSNQYRPSPTEKCNGLMDNNLFQAMNVSSYDISRWEYQIKKKQFGVPPEKKLPAGIIIKQNQENTIHRGKPVKAGTWYIAKGYTILADEIASYDEAFKLAKEIGTKIRGNAKKALIPPQLEHIQRTGLDDVLRNNNATGEMYLNAFEFKGGEFGNYMSEKDRQASLNMGYEALCDLAAALNISNKDISLNNRLSIAFGARGQGSAVAHYEPLREVINLTKMRGAGSLAHEWGHALDFITRQGDRVTEPVAKVLQKMKYREATIEEKQAHLQKQIQHSEKHLLAHLKNMLPESRLTEEQMQRRAVLIQELLDNPSPDKVEELSSFKKQFLGHVISKQDRETLGFYVRNLQIHKDRNTDFPLRIETEYYQNAKKMDSLCSKCDKGYWAEDVEIFARAFACYVNDKLQEKGGRSDYLCGHCESCVTFEMDRNGEMSIVKGFPEGEERKVINESFDIMIREYKELGYLHEPGHEQHIARKEIVENGQYELNFNM